MHAHAGYLLAGLAVAAPMLLGELAAAGVVVKPYVTDAQRAALAALGFPVPKDTRPSANSHLNARLAYYRPLHGVSKELPASTFVELPADEAAELCAAFVRACKAGVAVGGLYQVADPQAPDGGGLYGDGLWNDILTGVVGLNVDATARDVTRQSVEARLFGAHPELVPDAELTALGRACKRCMAAGQDADVGGLVGDAWGPLAAQRACRELALEMDERGYLIAGEPPEDPTILGGLGAAKDAVVDFAADLPGKVADLAAHGLAAAALSTPGLMILAGYLVWRATR